MAWRWHPLTEGSRGYNFRAGTHKWAGSELGRILRVVVGLVLVIAAYVTVIALYHSTGLGRPHEVAHGRPTADGTTVTLHVEQLQTIKGVLVANLAVSPGTELLDSQTQGLKDDLTVTVTSVVTPTKRTWSSGSLPGVFPVPLTISGDPANWPFDHYRSGPITVQLYRGAAHAPERVSVTFVDRLPGWNVDISGVGDAMCLPRTEWGCTDRRAAWHSAPSSSVC